MGMSVFGCVCVSHLLLKQRILIAHSLIHLFYHQKIHTTRESERKSDWEKKKNKFEYKKEMSFVRLQTVHIKICVPLHIPFECIHITHRPTHILSLSLTY